MSSEHESSDDEQQNTGPMRGQVTEKNPNYEKKKKCNCSKGCSKRSCSCFKFGSGCQSCQPGLVPARPGRILEIWPGLIRPYNIRPGLQAGQAEIVGLDLV